MHIFYIQNSKLKLFNVDKPDSKAVQGYMIIQLCPLAVVWKLNWFKDKSRQMRLIYVITVLDLVLRLCSPHNS